MQKQLLSGWGRTPYYACHIERPENAADAARLLQAKTNASLIARGNGCAYGDSAINATGTTLLTESLSNFDGTIDERGHLACEAGVTIGAVLAMAVPQGWLLPVMPGTKKVTIGGAIAADIHGRNHRTAGTFSAHVQMITILLADGSTVACGPDGPNAELFQATAGGMGLTGIILSARLKLRRLETSQLSVQTFHARGLAAIVATFATGDPVWEYSFARLIADLGTEPVAAISFGRHLSLAELPLEHRTAPLAVRSPAARSVPLTLPGPLVKPALRAINVWRGLSYKPQKEPSVVDFTTFFYPTEHLSGLGGLYGKRGFIQYQCVLPADVAQAGMDVLLKAIAASRLVVGAVVLNRFGPGRGWLSFPIDGYMLAVEMPLDRNLPELLRHLDQIVVQFSGRVYLAKDGSLSPLAFRAMYPDLPRWQNLAGQIDPAGRFASVQSQRLHLKGADQTL